MSVKVWPPASVALCLFLSPRTYHTAPFKNNFLIASIWAVLGRRCLARAVSSCGVQAPRGGGPLVAGRGLQGVWASVVAARGLRSLGSRARELRLGSWGTRRLVAPRPVGSFRKGKGSNPCLLRKQADSLPLSHQGSPSRRAELHLFISFPPPRGQKGARFISGLDARLNPGPCQIWWVDR